MTSNDTSKESGNQAALIEAEAQKIARLAEAARQAALQASKEAKQAEASKLPEVTESALTEAESAFQAAKLAYEKAKAIHAIDSKELAEAKKEATRKAKARNFAESGKLESEAEKEATRTFAVLEALRKQAAEQASIKAAEAKSGNVVNPNLEKRSESEAAMIQALDYSMDIEAHGFKPHTEKWQAYDMEVTVKQNYISKEGKVIDRHVMLAVGSMFDRLSTIKISYKKDSTEAFLTLGYFAHIEAAEGVTESLERFEILAGINEEGKAITPQALVYPSGKQKGKPILAEAKGVDSCRFTIAKLIPYSLPYIASRFDGDIGSEVDSISERIGKLESKIEALINKIADNDLNGKPTQKWETELEGKAKELTGLKAKLAESLSGKPEVTEAQKAEQAKQAAIKAEKLAAIKAKYQAMLEAASK